MTNSYYQKITKKDSGKKQAKYIKIFLKKKNTKGKRGSRRYQNLTKEEKEKRRNKNLFEEQKQKLVEYKKKNDNST